MEADLKWFYINQIDPELGNSVKTKFKERAHPSKGKNSSSKQELLRRKCLRS